jgi:hypothetical protein
MDGRLGSGRKEPIEEIPLEVPLAQPIDQLHHAETAWKASVQVKKTGLSHTDELSEVVSTVWV